MIINVLNAWCILFAGKSVLLQNYKDLTHAPDVQVLFLMNLSLENVYSSFSKLLYYKSELKNIQVTVLTFCKYFVVKVFGFWFLALCVCVCV